MTRYRLIERREQLDLTQEDVARLMRCSTRQYARYESGESTPRNGRRPALAGILHWTTAQLARALVDVGPSPVELGFTTTFLGAYPKLEQSSSRVQAWEPVVVQGLLQTRDYATAVELAYFAPVSDDVIARRVQHRLDRQAVLRRDPDPLVLDVVLDESVLRRVTGGPFVMARQLAHLAEMAQQPTITVQVLPLDGRAHTAAFGAFSLMTEKDDTSPSTACAEDLSGFRYHETPHTVDMHDALFRHLRKVALPADESLDLIHEIRRSITA